MMAEPGSVPSVPVGEWKSGSKQKKDCPNFQLSQQLPPTGIVQEESREAWNKTLEAFCPP